MEDDEGGGVGAASTVVVLIENRAKEVGVAAFDLSCSYQNTKTLLHFYDPMVIIVPQVKLAPDGMVGVSELVDKYYTLNKKITISRGCFDDTKGAMLVNNLATKKPSALGLDTYYKQYYLCLVATAATIKWVYKLKNHVGYHIG
ncbi:hypothetical protein IHE45_18G036100 [Dioscorea alata]|uniref:Uncharacterized protein n=1 Tax=Dioscorea alata TaxID=55571 RepID=A0ACB7U691_DIOAL|nr:hypothetical protein IHE45_18G036100 [Dioscorea alata]